MRSACIVMSVIFAQFAYFQRNDLDQFNTEIWYVWIAVYATCSVLSLVSAVMALPRSVYLFLSIGALVSALIRFTGLTFGEAVFFNDRNPAGNEAGGLMVVAIWLGVLFWKHKSLSSSKS